MTAVIKKAAAPVAGIGTGDEETMARGVSTTW